MTSATAPSGRITAIRLLDALVSHRYMILVAGAVYFWLGGLWLSGGSSGDWGYFVGYARSISNVPNIGLYVGPLSVLLALPFKAVSIRVGWLICSGICMALAAVSVRCVDAAAARLAIGDRRNRERAALVGGLFTLYAMSQPGVLAGHADDVLALTAIAVAVRAAASQWWILASVAVGAAIDSKPWAGLVLPLACACAGVRIRGLALAVASALLIWLPFFAIQHSGPDFASLNLVVEGGSGVHYLGAEIGSRPSWPRLIQLVIALPLGSYAVAKGRFYLVPVIALAVRVNLDPATTWYYEAGPVFGMFVWDVIRPTRLPGLRTAAACVAVLLVPKDLGLLHIFDGVQQPVFAVLRLLVFLVPAVALFCSERPKWQRECEL